MAHPVPPEQLNEQTEPVRSPRDDTRFAAGKIAFFQYLTVAVFLFLIAGFWDLQVQSAEVYQERAEANRIKSLPLLAPRGKILDRDGRIIVDNRPSYSVILSRDAYNPDHAAAIADGLNLERSEFEARLLRMHGPKFEQIVLKQELSSAEIAFVESHRDAGTFPELELIHSDRRLYPQDGLAAHVIGYVGEVSEAELNSPEMAKYNPGDVIGKFGIEKQYNDILRGVDGQKQVVVDNFGRKRRDLATKEAIPGKDLQLSIDLDLQAVAELAMEGRRGAVVALDPRDGEVFAMVSRPTFDPNKFTGRIRSKDWKEILDNPYNPMLNRAIQAQLAPGSTFKPIMALAGLETGTIDDATKFHCPGGASFYGHYFSCHKKSGHGGVNVHQAIAASCDVFFYNVGNKMGIDRIYEYAHMAGLGERTGVDLPNEAKGLVPSTEWKQRTARQKWYAGETISVSIGQGATVVTPLQLAAAIGGLATGGVWQRPHVIKIPSVNAPARKANLNLENVVRVIDGMYGVVNEGIGTAARARIPGIEVCGKTGTAQLASNKVLKGTSAGRSMKDNAWFVGFAGRQTPEIVVVALFENGEHGNLAAPIVRDVIKAYFDKKARLHPGPMLTQAAPTLRNVLLPLPARPSAEPQEEE